jgi:short-subunit dehydrogenase
MNTILITGASSGIGYATAIAAANQGWKVYACGRNEENLNTLSEMSPFIFPIIFDLTDKEICNQMLSTLQIDVALFNAGTCEYVEVEAWENDLFTRVFNANFFSTINCLGALLPNLRPGSQLVFVDSLARLLPFSKSQAYGASKAALHFLAKSLDADLKSKNIIVQTISPGFVATPLTDKNTFMMPMIISAEKAALKIIDAIKKKKRTVYFPFAFSSIVRLLAGLPANWKTYLCHLLKK